VKALIGTKLGMIQITAENGRVLPVTLVKAGPCVVTQVKNEEIDGYRAVQLSYGESKKLSKPLGGHVKKAKVSPAKLKEFRNNLSEELKVGDKLEVDVFEVGDKVKVTGINRGKGFAGTIKRHNFNSGPKSHGSKNVRKPGSIGSMYPQKVYKGRKMAGQYGARKSSVKNVEIALISKEESLIGIKGSLPGAAKGLISIEEVK